jgi:tetratricopeptide (TPR) repeat protein
MLRGYDRSPFFSTLVKTLEDLASVIELYHHTVGAGRYDEARELFNDRLHDLLYYRFGTYQICIELLRALFPDGEDQPPRLKQESDQAWTLNVLANAYSLWGHSRRAVPLFGRQIAIREEEGAKVHMGIGLGNLADDQFKLGELAAAEANLRRRIDLCHQAGDDLQEAQGRAEMGRLLVYRGAFAEAAGELDAAESTFRQRGNVQGRCVAWAWRALRALLMGEAEAGLEAGRRARELAEEDARTSYPVEHDFIWAEWLMGTALVALASGQPRRRAKLLSEAEAHITEALTRCRRINLVEVEPDILLAWARWHRVKGNLRQAEDHAKEALAIADRCDYRLKQAEIHNFLARLALEAGDRKAAGEHAATAYKHAWCDGPPHCYKPALEEAKRLLDELGVPPPRLKAKG